MADYKRIVSYMYDYEEGAKKNNVGFARVEARNGQCKIMINIKAPSLNNQNLKTYIFHRNNEKMIPIEVGDIIIRNGIGDFKTITRADNIMNSTAKLDQMCGIIVYFNDDKYFATEWDDKPVILHNFNGKEEIILENRPETSKNLEEFKFKEVNSVTKEEVDHQDKNPIEKEIIPQVENSKTKETVNRNLEEEIKHQERVIREYQLNVEDNLIASNQIKDYEKAIMTKDEWCSPAAKRIFTRYTKMFPFDDEQVAECVRIEPQDIGAFPMDNWVLGNNSFLLHGYYNYRHLIFARIRNPQGNQYIIGVPGFFQSKEKFMAKLFGFEDFKPVKQQEQINGEFGYWYTSINI